MSKNKKAIKAVLQEAQAYCDAEDKSTEFMISYMADMLCSHFGFEYENAHDKVMEYLCHGQ